MGPRWQHDCRITQSSGGQARHGVYKCTPSASLCKNAIVDRARLPGVIGCHWPTLGPRTGPGWPCWSSCIPDRLVQGTTRRLGACVVLVNVMCYRLALSSSRSLPALQTTMLFSAATPVERIHLGRSVSTEHFVFELPSCTCSSPPTLAPPPFPPSSLTFLPTCY
jgi:hypothetical protein